MANGQKRGFSIVCYLIGIETDETYDEVYEEELPENPPENLAKVEKVKLHFIDTKAIFRREWDNHETLNEVSWDASMERWVHHRPMPTCDQCNETIERLYASVGGNWKFCGRECLETYLGNLAS